MGRMRMSKLNKAGHKSDTDIFESVITIAIGERVQHELNSTLICKEVTGRFKRRMREEGGDE